MSAQTYWSSFRNLRKYETQSPALPSGLILRAGFPFNKRCTRRQATGCKILRNSDQQESARRRLQAQDQQQDRNDHAVSSTVGGLGGQEWERPEAAERSGRSAPAAGAVVTPVEVAAANEPRRVEHLVGSHCPRVARLDRPLAADRRQAVALHRCSRC